MITIITTDLSHIMADFLTFFHFYVHQFLPCCVKWPEKDFTGFLGAVGADNMPPPSTTATSSASSSLSPPSLSTSWSGGAVDALKHAPVYFPPARYNKAVLFINHAKHSQLMIKKLWAERLIVRIQRNDSDSIDLLLFDPNLRVARY